MFMTGLVVPNLIHQIPKKNLMNAQECGTLTTIATCMHNNYNNKILL